MENKKEKKISDDLKKSDVIQIVGSPSKVIKITEGVIKTSYIFDVQLYSEVQDTKGNTIGFVKGVSEYEIEIYLTVYDFQVAINSEVIILNKKISIKFHDKILGSIINPLGEFISSFTSREDIPEYRSTEIFKETPNISSRSKLDDQFITGYNIIDFIFPIGYGQRMLLVGNRQTYKTTCMIEMINNIISNRKNVNRDQKTICIYVAIGQTKSDTSHVAAMLMKNKIGNTMIIAANASDPLGLQYLAPYSAMSIADFYANNNYNIVVFLDDLSKHAKAYRELYLLSGHKPGRQFYSSDIFYTHSSLLEKALNYKDGGSITAIIGIETIDSEMDYITTNVISITDGQIFFDIDKKKQNIIPPICTSLSVSRTGASIQIPEFRFLMQKIRLSLSEYYQSVDFYNNYKDECDEQIVEIIKSGLYTIQLLYTTNENGAINCMKQLCIYYILKNDILYQEYSIEDIESDIFINQIELLINETVKIVSSKYEKLQIDSSKYSQIYKDIGDTINGIYIKYTKK